MPTRVHVNKNFLNEYTEIYIIGDAPDGSKVYHNFAAASLIRVAPNDLRPKDHLELEPLQLSDDEARALMEALIRHFNSVPSDATLIKAMLDKETQRVDKFINQKLGIPNA